MINTDAIPGAHRFSHQAMATIYEILIVHEDANYAQQAACEAFDGLDRLEQELSRFIENSDISRINHLPANQSVRLGLAAFECLQLSDQIYKETQGAFDITVGSLLKCWLNEDKTNRIPSQDELELARQRTGLHLVQLDENAHTVKLDASPIHIDLGGIGKGYAIDRMAELLRDWDFDTALIHGGTSSVFAIGVPPGTKGWPLTLSSPTDRRQTIVRLYLRDQALSGSGLQKGHHIINPRTARPVKGNLAAWARAPAAATTDALSTAFMIMSSEEVQDYCLRNQDVSGIIATEEREDGKEKTLYFGSWDEGELFKS